LASAIGVTRQTVLDVETGLYIQPVPAMLRHFSLSLGIPQRELLTEYRSWIALKRAAAIPILSQVPPAHPSITSFRDYALSVARVSGVPSVKGFCRLTCLQTSIVNGYLADGYRAGAVASALLECQLEPRVVARIMSLPTDSEA
jgi:hypothetical protein